MTGSLEISWIFTHVNEAEACQNLFEKQLLQAFGIDSDVILNGLCVDIRLSIIARKDDSARQIDDFFERLARR